MPSTALQGLQAFELRTERTKTLLPLEGSLHNWQDSTEHQVAELSILGRAGAVHQSNGQGPRRFVFRCLLLDPGASDRYNSTERTLADDPFGTCVHPRLGQFDYVYRGLSVTEDLEGQVNGLLIELKIDETGLRDLIVLGAQTPARAAQSAAQAVLSLVASAISRAANVAPPDLTLPLSVPVPPALSALIKPALDLAAAADAFVPLVDDTTTQQQQLAAALVEIGSAADAFAAVAGTAVSAYPMVAKSRLAYGEALRAYQQAAAQGPPLIPDFRVPGKMSLSRLCAALYGGGARAMEAEILRLNEGRIRTPYALPAGLVIRILDPAHTKIEEGRGLVSLQDLAAR